MFLSHKTLTRFSVCTGKLSWELQHPHKTKVKSGPSLSVCNLSAGQQEAGRYSLADTIFWPSHTKGHALLSPSTNTNNNNKPKTSNCLT